LIPQLESAAAAFAELAEFADKLSDAAPGRSETVAWFGISKDAERLAGEMADLARDYRRMVE
jgi:hypothetical protein